MAIQIGILTVSDRCSTGTAVDTSGPAIRKMLLQYNSNYIIDNKMVPDDINAIQTAVLHWCDHLHYNAIFTTGGTGFAIRDTTPEAITPLLHRLTPGIVTQMLTQSLKVILIMYMINNLYWCYNYDKGRGDDAS